MDEPVEPKRSGDHYTIKSLNLNLKAAEAGKLWLLLPEGFRDRDSGYTYPLPSRRQELQRLVAIYIPPKMANSGCVYLKRAIKQWKELAAQAQSLLLQNARREHELNVKSWTFNRDMKKHRRAASEAVAEVKEVAQEAIASLNDLFALGRKGIDAQMRAHLEGQQWQGEPIDAAAFRQCFRMVTQAVKGMGLPSGERSKAQEAIMQEVAASIEATQDALALAPQKPPEEPETTH